VKKTLSIIGGGSCALFLANAIDPNKYELTLYEHNAALGRKFLVAGDGGLNLTHSEPSAAFIQRYTPSDFLKPHFIKFDNQYFMRWLEEHGVPVYVGSSGRVFPKRGLKPVQVLDAILKGFAENTRVVLRTKWKGFSAEGLFIEQAGSEMNVRPDLTIFCLGGASWSVTGSTGTWLEEFAKKGIEVEIFAASNCRFVLDWPVEVLQKLQGQPLKNCDLRCGDVRHLGEIVFTQEGIEGSGVYPLSPAIRAQMSSNKSATVYVDFKPQNTEEELLQRFYKGSEKLGYTERIKEQLNLNAMHIQVLKTVLSKDQFLSPELLCAHLKALPFVLKGLGPIDDAISTVGGISLDEIDAYFQLKKMPNHFVIGEMLNYDAPTGGYLLQSCFSMAMALAEHLNNKA
jgi:hypothetical protein